MEEFFYNNISINLFFTFFWIATVIVLFFMYLGYKKSILNIKELSLIIILLILSGSLWHYIERTDILYLTSRYMPVNLIFTTSSLIILVVKTLPVLVLTFIVYKLSNKNPEIRIDTNDVIQKVFNTGAFLTSFSKALPKGEKDSEYGLDYIPFMLENLIEKRKRFQKVSQFWLYCTMILGSTFIITVIYFAKILLNDESVGIYKISKELKDELNNSNEIIKNEYGIKDVLEYKNYGIDVEYLLNISSKLKGDIRDSMLENSKRFKSTKDLVFYTNFLERNIDSIDTQVSNEATKLHAEMQKINGFLASQEYNLKKFPRIVEKIERLTIELDEKIDEPQNRTNELIKRLVLSLIVISFLLTLLRFVAHQYKSNYIEMIKAEEEDLYVRKIYIGLKNAQNDNDSIKLVLSNLLGTRIKSEEKEANLTNNEANILKSTIETILSKISGK